MIYKQIISNLPLPSTVFSFNTYFNSITRESKRDIIKMNAYACDNKNLLSLYKEDLEKDSSKRMYKQPLKGRHFKRKTLFPYQPRQSLIFYRSDNLALQTKVDQKPFESSSVKIEKRNKEIPHEAFQRTKDNAMPPVELTNENENNVTTNNPPSTNNNEVVLPLSIDCLFNNSIIATQTINIRKEAHCKYPSMTLNSSNYVNCTNSNLFKNDKCLFLKTHSERGKSNDFKKREKKLFERKIATECQGVTSQCQSLQSFLSKNSRHHLPLSLSNEESTRLLNNSKDVMIEHLESAKRRQKKTFSIHTHLYDNARAVKESACLSKLNATLALSANKALKKMIFKRKSINKYKEYNDTDYKALMTNHAVLYQKTMKLIKKNQKAIKRVNTKFVQYKVK